MKLTEHQKKAIAWTDGDIRTVASVSGVSHQSVANWRAKWGTSDGYFHYPGATTYLFADWLKEMRAKR